MIFFSAKSILKLSDNMIKRIFRCNVCGATFPATKTKGATHYGHIKDMYCFKCKTIQKCTQVDADGHIGVGGR